MFETMSRQDVLLRNGFMLDERFDDVGGLL